MSITTKGISFGYGVQTGARATAVAAAKGLRVRDEGGVSMFKPNMAPVKARIKDGKWGAMDYTEYAGITKPGWTHPGYLTIAWLQDVLAGVMAASSPDGSGNITYTLVTGAQCKPTATSYLSIIRRNALASSKDHRLTGAVAKSIKISSSESSQGVKMDTDFIAGAVNYAYSGASDTYTLPGDSFLLHKGLTVTLSSAIQCPEFDLNIDFGTYPVVDNAAAPQEEMLGPFNLSGTVRAPWVDDDVMNDHLASVGNTLVFSWGATGVSGWLSIICPVKWTEPDEDADNETRLRQGIPFEYSQTTGTAFSIILKP
jgi:hypothetical protein